MRRSTEATPTDPPRVAAAFALLVALLFVAAPASAYNVHRAADGTPFHWDGADLPVGYQLVVGNVPGGAAGEAAVRRGFDTWSGVTENLRYAFDGYVVSGRPGQDGRNLVVWIYEDWPYDPRLLAGTIRYHDRATGRILEADVAFNGQEYLWSVGGPHFDIESIAAHEAGHVSGLGHSDVRQATMWTGGGPGDTWARTLSQDDRAGIDAIYGGVSRSYEDPTEEETREEVESATTVVGGSGGGSGGCSVHPAGSSPAGSSGEWLPSLFALALAAYRRRRRMPRRSARAASNPAGQASPPRPRG